MIENKNIESKNIFLLENFKNITSTDQIKEEIDKYIKENAGILEHEDLQTTFKNTDEELKLIEKIKIQKEKPVNFDDIKLNSANVINVMTNERKKNLIKQICEIATCKGCMNVIKSRDDGKVCKNCDSFICKLCYANSININQSSCPSCYVNNFTTNCRPISRLEMISSENIQFKCHEHNEVFKHEDYIKHVKDHLMGNFAKDCIYGCGQKMTQAQFINEHLTLIDNETALLRNPELCQNQMIECNLCGKNVKCTKIQEHQCLINIKKESLLSDVESAHSAQEMFNSLPYAPIQYFRKKYTNKKKKSKSNQGFQGAKNENKVCESILRKWKELGALNVYKLIDDGLLTIGKYKKQNIQINVNPIKPKSGSFDYIIGQKANNFQSAGLVRIVCQNGDLFEGYHEGKDNFFGRCFRPNSGSVKVGWFRKKYGNYILHGYGKHYAGYTGKYFEKEGLWYRDTLIKEDQKSSYFDETCKMAQPFEDKLYYVKVDLDSLIMNNEDNKIPEKQIFTEFLTMINAETRQKLIESIEQINSKLCEEPMEYINLSSTKYTGM